MALDYRVESIEGLDANVASLYEQSENGYVLSVSGLPESEDPIKLKETLVKVREERRREEREKRELKNKYEREISEFKTKYAEVDPEEYKSLKTLQQEIAAREEEQKLKEMEAKKDWEALQKRIEDKHRTEFDSFKNQSLTEIQKKEERIQTMQSSLHKHIAQTEVVKEIVDAKGKIKILRPHIDPYVKVIEDNGEYVVRVTDDAGNVRTNSNGEHLSIKDFIQELKEHPDFQGDGIFERDKKPGGSDSTGNRTSQVNSDNPWAKDSFNLTKQGEIIRKDPALAAKLKAQAGL